MFSDKYYGDEAFRLARSALNRAVMILSVSKIKKLLILVGSFVLTWIIYVNGIALQPGTSSSVHGTAGLSRQGNMCSRVRDGDPETGSYQHICATELLNRKFLANMKNPCWKSEENGFECLPYFFLLGFPKCATTDLYDKMIQHAQICHTREKEWHWWTRLRFQQPFPGAVVYTKYFGSAVSCLQSGQNAVSDKIVGDFTVSNAWDDRNYYSMNVTVLPAVLRPILPNARFIFLLRDPVSRFISNYRYLARTETSAEDLHRSTMRKIVAFNDCLKTCCMLNNTTKSMSCCMLNYDSANTTTCLSPARHDSNVPLIVGMYWYHIAKWFKYYPREQFLILRTEDYHNNLEETLSLVTTHLGIRPFTQDELTQLAGQTEKNPSRKPFEPKKETIDLLRDYYREHNAKLVQLLDDERFYWR